MLHADGEMHAAPADAATRHADITGTYAADAVLPMDGWKDGWMDGWKDGSDPVQLPAGGTANRTDVVGCAADEGMHAAAANAASLHADAADSAGTGTADAT